MSRRLACQITVLIAAGLWLAGCTRRPVAPVTAAAATTTAGPRAEWPRFTLQAKAIWLLNLPNGERFDASGLVQLPEGGLLTVSDRGPTLYRIQFRPDTNAADLLPLPNCFTRAQLAPFAAQKTGRYDCEGVARDEQGRLYLCEEANRWILRGDPAAGTVERLDIDWSPVRRFFDPTDNNASFEGITIHDGTLFVANERKWGRLMAVDLDTLKVTDHFVVRPAGSHHRDIQYSDLCWFDGALYVLCRRDRVVLKVDPASHHVLAQYDYRAMEEAPAVRYHTIMPVGFMEGLAVDHDYFWLVTDNNGFSRSADHHDRRPTLFKCRRPDR